jgi:hypothetical protein
MVIKIKNIQDFSESDCRSICLRKVLEYYKDFVDLREVNQACNGTYKSRDWDYLLGKFALSRGFPTTIHTRSLTIFDPTWFDLEPAVLLKKVGLKRENLEELSKSYPGFNRFHSEAKAIEQFMESGGRLDFSPFSTELLDRYLLRNIPIICTMTGQLVYNSPKERQGKEDDLMGDPWNHSLILVGHSSKSYSVLDPSKVIGKSRYRIKKEFLLDAVIRYDNNIILVEPKKAT